MSGGRSIHVRVGDERQPEIDLWNGPDTDGDSETATGTPSATPTATATATAGGPSATPSCLLKSFEGFDDITTLTGAGWVPTNDTVVGTTR